MPSAPSFWYGKPGALARALIPFSAIYARLARSRAARITPYRSKLPVICIGNFTAGGGGKTPTAIGVAKMLQATGNAPLLSHARLWRTDSRAASGEREG